MVSGRVESCGDSDGFYGFFFTMKVQVTFFSKYVPKSSQSQSPVIFKFGRPNSPFLC